jgi:hypothetical protein
LEKRSEISEIIVEINDLREFARPAFSLLASPVASPETWAEELQPPGANKPAKRTRLNRLFILASSLSSRFGAGRMFISLIAVTIMTQVRKTKKPTGVFWYAFFAEKCVLRRFFGHRKQSTSQPPQHERFRNDAKTGHLYDRGVFSSWTPSGHFRRNILKIK